MSPSSPAETYAFCNDDVESVDRHDYLSAILDGFTFARLSSVGDLAGRRCLEVGAGGGSVARWLADRVGPGGEVLATDINTSRLPQNPGYAVLAHDLTTDPVPAGAWDLIHARLVLLHVPGRREILGRLAAALAPGGALVIEEWDGSVGSAVLAAPADADAELLASVMSRIGQILRAHGADQTWARQLHRAMLEESLINVDTEVHARAWQGGTPGALLPTVTIAQLRDELEDTFDAEELARVDQLLHDPRLVLRGILTYSTIGRRPGTAAPTGS